MLLTTLNTSQRTIFMKYKKVKEMRKVDYQEVKVDKSRMLEVLCLMGKVKKTVKGKEILWEEVDYSATLMRSKTTLI
jgi:hypothetical protein